MRAMRHLSNDLPVYTIQRRQWVNEMAEHAEDYDADHDPMYVIFYAAIVLTAWTGVLLTWWYL